MSKYCALGIFIVNEHVHAKYVTNARDTMQAQPAL